MVGSQKLFPMKKQHKCSVQGWNNITLQRKLFSKHFFTTAFESRSQTKHKFPISFVLSVALSPTCLCVTFYWRTRWHPKLRNDHWNYTPYGAPHPSSRQISLTQVKFGFGHPLIFSSESKGSPSISSGSEPSPSSHSSSGHSSGGGLAGTGCSVLRFLADSFGLGLALASAFRFSAAIPRNCEDELNDYIFD